MNHINAIGGNDGIEIKFGSYGNIVRDNVGAYESEGYAKNPGWQIQTGFKVTR